MSTLGRTSEPYGPCTALIRKFLVQFAGLGADAKRIVVSAHEARVERVEYQAAETRLGHTIERVGRTEMRDALAGPLMQLVRHVRTDAGVDLREGSVKPEADALAELEPIAEAALAALLALMVSDVLPTGDRDVLYSPFATVIPMPQRKTSGES